MTRLPSSGFALPGIVLGAAGLVLAANVLELFGIPYQPVGFVLNVIAAIVIFACLFFIVARRAEHYRRQAAALAVAAAAFAGSLFFQTDLLAAVEQISGPVRRAIIDSLAEGGLGIAIAALVSLLVASDRQHTELSRVAEIDPLTGLLNRKSFHEAFRTEWERSARHGRPLSCALLDIDFFKRVNDDHGHAAGDAALVALARLLQQHTRPTDHLCRHGGDEFCILLPETAESDAALWAERIRVAIERMPIDATGTPLSITACVGVAQKLDDVESPDQLIALADEALLAAKQAGRNCMLRYAVLASTDEPSRKAVRRNRPLAGMAAADVMVPLVPCVEANDTRRVGAGKPRDKNARLVEIVATLIKRGEHLRDQLQQEQVHVLPTVVCEATRIQELTTDLLAQCQAYRGA